MEDFHASLPLNSICGYPRYSYRYSEQSHRDSEQSLQNSTLRLEKVMSIVASGADVNASDHNGITPLHLECGNSNVELLIVKFLLESGANVNATDSNDRTPLHNICQVFNSIQGFNEIRVDVVKLLLEWVMYVFCTIPLYYHAILDMQI